MLPLVQAVSEPMSGLTGWAVDVIESLGGLGLVVLCALDSMVPVIPADLVLPWVGLSATQGAIGLGAAIAWTTAGSVAGSLVLYSLGALLGRERARALLTKIPGFKEPHFDRAEAWFARHGAKAVLFGRLVPAFRTVIAVPAGVERMPLPKFALLTTIGSLTSNSTALVAGYLLGEKFPYVFGSLAVAAVTVLVLKRRSRRRKETATAAGPPVGRGPRAR